MNEDQIIREAMAEFPEEFGLRRFPGEKFKIAPGACFVRDWDDPNSVMLYTARLCEDGTWKAFAKGTPAELKREVVKL